MSIINGSKFTVAYVQTKQIYDEISLPSPDTLFFIEDTTEIILNGKSFALGENLLGVANGLATLDGSGFVPASQLPSYVDDVVEFQSSNEFTKVVNTSDLSHTSGILNNLNAVTLDLIL